MTTSGPSLLLHVHGRLAVLEQQARERVAEVVEPHPPQLGLREHLVATILVMDGHIPSKGRCVRSSGRGSAPACRAPKEPMVATLSRLWPPVRSAWRPRQAGTHRWRG